MKIVSVVIKPEQLPDVKQALFDIEIRHFTASSVKGTAPTREQQMYRGVQKEVSLFQRIQLDIALPESRVESAIDAITAAAKETGGHGIIFVKPLDDIVIVWTGERGDKALK